MSTWREHLKVHPAADVFPMMSDEELAALGEDVKANGQTVPIILWNGVLIDGRNRMEAMERIGIVDQAMLSTVACEDPVSYIISLNIHRRHLSKAEQADLIVAAHKAAEKPQRVSAQVEPKLSKRGRKGEGRKADPVKAAIIADAKKADISEGTVKRALAKAEGKKPKPTPTPTPKKAEAKPKPKSRAAGPSHIGPSTLDGWRRGYINACRIGAPDLYAERETILGAFREIAGKRAIQAQNRASTLPPHGRSKTPVDDPTLENCSREIEGIVNRALSGRGKEVRP